MGTTLNFTKKSVQHIAFAQSTKPIYYSDAKVAGLRLKVGKTKKTFLLEKRIRGYRGSAIVIRLGTFPTVSIDDVRREAKRLASLCEQGIDPRREDTDRKQVSPISNFPPKREFHQPTRARCFDSQSNHHKANHSSSSVKTEKSLNSQKRSTRKNPNHPKKGSSIKVAPIIDRQAIETIKANLKRSPRDLCFFIVGINTAFRANELLSLKVRHVQHLRAGNDFEIKLSKTKTYRRVTVNQAVVTAVQEYLAITNLKSDDWLFPSAVGGKPLSVSTVSRYVKSWCQDAGLIGNYASHSLRKTWGYWQRVANDTPIPLLMTAFGHSNQQQTLQYLCIQNEEISGVYLNLEL